MFPTKLFENKHILVGVTGCIAAYKSCELIRYLIQQQAQVQVMMTRSATRFISPLTMETLSGHPVKVEMFPDDEFVGTHHIHLSDWADGTIVAPATANILAKVANGVADDFVSTVLLALHTPVVYAPAMNTHMWNNAAVQKNVETLQAYGALICPPEEGFLAEGYSGVGRLARLEYLIQYLYKTLHPRRDSLKGKTVLITAGPTREGIDPVRYISNRSSGKMGFSLVWEAFARGAKVILVHGPTELTVPQGVYSVPVQTATEMYEAVRDHFKETDILISAAAVADYRPTNISAQKIKKNAERLTLELVSNPDVLVELAKIKKSQIMIGFAVETENGIQNAIKKMERKNLDGIVLNEISEEKLIFGSDYNQGVLIKAGGEKKPLQQAYKLDIAREIFEYFFTPK